MTKYIKLNREKTANRTEALQSYVNPWLEVWPYNGEDWRFVVEIMPEVDQWGYIRFNVSEKEAAARLNLDQTTIKKIDIGTRDVSYFLTNDELVLLCRFNNYPIYDLSGDGSEKLGQELFNSNNRYEKGSL